MKWFRLETSANNMFSNSRTEAAEIPGGVLIKTVEVGDSRDAVAMAMVFVPGVRILVEEGRPRLLSAD